MIDAVVIRRYRALRDVRFAPKQLTLARVLRATDGISMADIVLERSDDGATQIQGQRLLDQPTWPE